LIGKYDSIVTVFLGCEIRSHAFKECQRLVRVGAGSTVGKYIDTNLLVVPSALTSLRSLETALEHIFIFLGFSTSGVSALPKVATLIPAKIEQVRMSTLDFGSVIGCFTGNFKSSGS
jgi:hypothetical protein